MADRDAVRRRQAGRRLAFAGIALAALVTSGCPPTPDPPSSIGADQTFRGLVNGTGDGAVVTTVCPGPGTPGGMGHVAGGQLVAATRDPSGPGNTGDNAAIFVEPNGSAQVIRLEDWDVPVEIPTDLDVPCDGKGLIVFDPCFGFVGCRGAAQQATVKVTFVNIAD